MDSPSIKLKPSRMNAQEKVQSHVLDSSECLEESPAKTHNQVPTEEEGHLMENSASADLPYPPPNSNVSLNVGGNSNPSRTSLKFKESTSLSDHSNEFQGIIDQMSRMDINFEYEIMGLLLLNSLPKPWKTFKVFITNSTLNGVVSLQMVKGSVLNEEMRRKAQGSSSQSKKNKGKKGKSKEKDDDRVTTATGGDLVILRDFESVNLVFDESIWIIDSGATLHVTLRN
ncbi:hypothetical protein CR513_32158, partial [Mucuna pruriens]